jgi:hypothetical protein
MSRFSRLSLYFAIVALVVAMPPVMLIAWASVRDAPPSLWLVIPGAYLLVQAAAVVLLAITLWRNRSQP